MIIASGSVRRRAWAPLLIGRGMCLKTQVWFQALFTQQKNQTGEKQDFCASNISIFDTSQICSFTGLELPGQHAVKEY